MLVVNGKGRGATTKNCDARPHRFLRVDMRAVQGAVSTPQGAYLAYVTKEHGAATKKCDAEIPLHMKIESDPQTTLNNKSIIKYPHYNIVIKVLQAFFTGFLEKVSIAMPNTTTSRHLTISKTALSIQTASRFYQLDKHLRGNARIVKRAVVVKRKAVIISNRIQLVVGKLTA